MSLADLIAQRIASEGPISVAEYMTDCLLHPTYGYYTTQPVFGRTGDFITAPEINQMFGEMIGLCLAQSWMDQGSTEAFTLAELGPGRGTLMADILRAASKVPGFSTAARVTLVEASPRLREVQCETLRGHAITFCDTAADLPDAPLFLVANEFFDALPIRQFIRGEAHWRERLIGLREGTLALGLGPDLPQPQLAHRLDDTQPEDCVEYAPGAQAIIEAVSTRIRAHGGAGLIIDYGDWRSLGDTLQALRAHQPANPLCEPGLVDLTAHVDFEALAQGSRCRFTKLTPQGFFLERLGIAARAQTLATKLTGKALETHVGAYRRLTHPEEMGNLFKVLGLFADGSAPPPGLNE